MGTVEFAGRAREIVEARGNCPLYSEKGQRGEVYGGLEMRLNPPASGGLRQGDQRHLETQAFNPPHQPRRSWFRITPIVIAYHSCQHRAYPNCGGLPAANWLARQKLRLLPAPYFLQTYTVPAELRPLFQIEPKFCYHLLFAVSAQALREVALSKLGGEPAALGVLHTWSRQLVFHPHVHYIVPGGFLSPNQLRWIRLKDPNFLLPERVLSRRVRNLFRARLQAERPDLFAQVPARVWRVEWVVNTQPVGSGEKALGYRAAYVQRTALSAQRIVQTEHGQTTFQYRARDTGPVKPDGHGAGGWKRLTLDTGEFLRRFLQHVLPTGFHRVRYFGWWSPAAKARWARVLALLDWKAPSPPPPRPAWAMRCPGCGQPMVRLAVLPRLPFKPP